MSRKIATIDAETDPFKHGRKPMPFVWGFYDGEIYRHFDSTRAMLEYLEDYSEPLTIYAHNGGKFDFLFFIEKLVGAIRIVNGRILEAKLGKHTIRDSYAILPMSLSKLGAGKESIDFKLMEPEVRHLFMDEILHYLKADCVSLHKVVTAFLEQFGDRLTIGSTAMAELKKYHKFDTVSEAFDKFHRSYYFGGRCQCFETGVIQTNIKVFDINSAYPDAMDKLAHPVGKYSRSNSRVSKNTAFVRWIGTNKNAVPTRTKTGLDFTVKEGEFFTTIHEFIAAQEWGVIKVKKVIEAIDFDKWMIFSDFVQYFYESRKIARKQGDMFLEIFYKLILNSAYGKFAQNPENYVDSIILPWGEVPGPGYNIEYRHDDYAIWSKPAMNHSRYNVATAASITGGVRAVLLKGLANSVRPLYCDTDSIFCNEMKGDHDETKLGSWKLEAEGDVIAIAGKKLYALMKKEDKKENEDESTHENDTLVKKASKGSNLPPMAIFSIARGDTVEHANEAPTFKLGSKVTTDEDGSIKRTASSEVTFIKRRIRKTTLQEGSLI